MIPDFTSTVLRVGLGRMFLYMFILDLCVFATAYYILFAYTVTAEFSLGPC
jgi:hypothetical protein